MIPLTDTLFLISVDPSIFLETFIYLFIFCVKLSRKTAYPTMVDKIFKFMVFRLLENAFACQKNEGIYSHSPLGKTLPEVLILTPSRWKLLIPQKSMG